MNQQIAASDTGTIRPSPFFFAVVAAFGIGAWLCLSGRFVSAGVAVFIFVLSGWVLSLIFHEFAHAVVAWRGGDLSIVDKGYLTLDPRLYADPLTSIAIPLFFLVIGGIGLPGGAVWINRAALRSSATATAVSLAGPATNLVFAALCLGPLSLGIVTVENDPVFASGLAFLGFLQVFAFVLNMLPVPGLDGFGAIEPHLPYPILAAVAPIRRWAILILFAALFYVQPVRSLVFGVINGLVDFFGVDRSLVDVGWILFRFWE